MISELLLSALLMVESSGAPHPRDGDGGRAVGVYQIHSILIRDVNRIYGTRYTHAQARNPAIAREICIRYLTHYATPARIGRAVTDQDRARIWNGGGEGWRRRATIPYWHKVRAEMALRSKAEQKYVNNPIPL